MWSQYRFTIEYLGLQKGDTWSCFGTVSTTRDVMADDIETASIAMHDLVKFEMCDPTSELFGTYPAIRGFELVNNPMLNMINNIELLSNQLCREHDDRRAAHARKRTHHAKKLNVEPRRVARRTHPKHTGQPWSMDALMQLADAEHIAQLEQLYQ
jgi:hypothetical protein